MNNIREFNSYKELKELLDSYIRERDFPENEEYYKLKNVEDTELLDWSFFIEAISEDKISIFKEDPTPRINFFNKIRLIVEGSGKRAINWGGKTVKKQNIKFYNLIFEEKIYFYFHDENNFKKTNFKVKNCTFKKGIDFGERKTEDAKFEDSNIELLIIDSNIDNIDYKGLESMLFEVNDIKKSQYGIIKKIKIINSYIGKLHFYKNNFKKLKVYNSTIKNFIFENIKSNTGSEIILDSLEVNDLKIKNSIFLSDVFKLNTIKVLKTFVVYDVDFGKCLFNNFQMSDKCKKKIFLPVFNDCIFNNINFGKNIRMTDDDGKEHKDTYRQLKYVMEKNGNHMEANKFYAKEMSTYGKELTTLSPNWWLFQLQRIISNFGNMWYLTLFWIFVLPLVGYLVTYLYYLNSDLMVVDKLGTIYVNLLNPIYKDYFETGDNWTHFGFILYKAFYGVLLYQLGVGLRRQTKR